MRLVTVASLLEPPADVVQRLQELDPTVDLYYAGAGEWWLGRVKRDSPRRLAGLKRLAGLERLWGGRVRPVYLVPVPRSAWDRWKERHVPRWLRWLLPVRHETVRVSGVGMACPWADECRARLMADGFGLIEQVVPAGELGGQLVESFRIGNWLYRHTPEHELDRQVFDATAGKAAKAARLARMSDFVQTEGRWFHRRIMRHQLRLPVSGFRTA